LELRNRYDVAVIGAGVQGLATAYGLAKRGLTDVVVLEKGYIGCGASGRNGALVSSTFHTKEWLAIYSAAIRKFENLSQQLGINTLFTKRGGLEIISDEEDWRRQDAALSLQHSMNVRTSLLNREEVADLIPSINSQAIMGGVFNPDSGVVRHDAVLWGYAQKASTLGVEVHPFTEVVDIERGTDDFTVCTTRGQFKCNRLVNAAGAEAGSLCSKIGIELPVWPRRAEALVTEPVKPFLNPFVTYGPLNAYGHQTARGELVAGTVLDFKMSNDLKSSFTALRQTARAFVKLFPRLRSLNVLRQWVGTPCETPDHSPILGKVDEVKNVYLNVGWGGYGFMSGPASGELLAELILTERTPELISPFRLSRFREGKPVIETSLVSLTIWKTAPISIETTY
jgi:sarcosine oxidase subunit beta